MIKKKSGITFLEIIFALSIILIVMIPIFNTIIFSTIATGNNRGIQNSQIESQNIYESIKSLGEREFIEYLISFKENKLGYEIGGGVLEIEDPQIRELFRGDERSGKETFKVYKLRGSDEYLKVSFEGMNFEKDNFGIDIKYGDTEENFNREGWKNPEECSLRIFVDKEDSGIYALSIGKYKEDFERRLVRSEIGDFAPQIHFKDRGIEFKDGEESIFIEGVKSNGGLIYIENKINEGIDFHLTNDTEERIRIYLKQNGGLDTTEKFNFISKDKYVQIYMKDSVPTEFGEGLRGYSTGGFIIESFKYIEGKMISTYEIRGVKKFKRFRI